MMQCLYIVLKVDLENSGLCDFLLFVFYVKKRVTVVPSGVAMLEVQSFSKESLIVPEDGLVYL